MHFIKKSSSNSIDADGLLALKSEEAFLPYEGKTIRYIIVNQYRFEKTFIDTTKSINYFGTKILNRLHKDTRQWAIRDDLFIHENTPLAVYQLADNERYLRSLDYIQDARIIVKPITGTQDSVDVYVITKDFFSLNGQLNNASPGKFKAKVGDVNLFGAAQNLQGAILIEKDRSPAIGTGIMYTKYNVAGTFIDATVGYTTINRDLHDGTMDEHAGYVTLQRILVSQYSHFAGGLTVGKYQSFNNYSKPEDYFFNYSYHVFDSWLGYNLGPDKLIKDRTRKANQFISLRYFNTFFSQTPVQVQDKLNFRFNNKEAVLAQFTFFKQGYYKTNYIYGFGTTEDIPYGYNMAFTLGMYQQAYLSRPYAGLDANRYKVYNRGDIVQYFLRAGSFWDRGKWQDANILLGVSGFSRLFLFNNFKLRQYMRLSYTRQFNRIGLDPLGINNAFGLRYFSSDSITGNQRFSLHSETITFINYKVLGFKFSPFAFADVVALNLYNETFNKSVWYYGLGGGIRTRNENLVFRTSELRIVYFPRKGNQTQSFKATLAINFRFRYNTNYVLEPDIIQLNSDSQNNIF
ncbi:MAG TPA: hypothetical protein VEV83_00150 [Parafilimonas sp.]|nr:hypothetical protein [Parafilimonas sp.]